MRYCDERKKEIYGFICKGEVHAHVSDVHVMK